MIPILYGANETAFTSQGFGALGDAVSVKIARVLNGKDELTMVYPNEGIRYADLQNDRIIYAEPEYKKGAHPYAIYKITKPMNGLVTVYARHVGTQRASYLPVLPFSDSSLVGVLNKLSLNMVETNPFTFWTNKSTLADFALARPASLGNVLGGMSGSILDVYGGEYEFDGYTIKLWNKRGVDRGVELRYGKNITDIEQSEDFASVVTGIVPYWEGMDGETVTLPEHVVYGSLASAYAFARTIVKDFSEQFDDEPTEAQLRAAASAYVETVQLPSVSLKVNFEHLAQYTEYEGMGLLETVNLGDTVHIYYEPLGVLQSARIVNTTYDCLNEKYDAVQIGSVKGNLEQVMSQMANTTETLKETVVKNLPSALETAVENATDLITGVDGGYIKLNRDANGKPYEILIMDEEDIADATYIIRLNKNGIGFSTNGGVTYANAWTIDGSLVADFITSGVLNAAILTAGIIRDQVGDNYWNLETGEINIATSNLNNDIADLYASLSLTAQELLVTVGRVDNIRTGGRNLLKQSAEAYSNTTSPTATYYFGNSAPADGEEVTLQIKGYMGDGAETFSVYNSGDTILAHALTSEEYDTETGRYRATFNWTAEGADNTFVNVYSLPADPTRTASIEWIKLERGNQATDWSPAPEDQTEATEAAQAAAEEAATSAEEALETTRKVEATMQFTVDGLKISGTEGSRDNSYVLIGADSQTFVVDNVEVMELGADGIVTQADITAAGTITGGAFDTGHWTITENASSVWSLNYHA